MLPSLTLDDYRRGLEAGDRTVLARAITLVEGTRPDQRELASQLLQAILPRTGQAIRLGITGVPGVGKSSFIERLGLELVRRKHALAVLAIDPSSARSGGSILGDKSRMNRLARAPEAFIRPSPSGTHLGGIARRTRESMLLCEAAGMDVVLVETVGVGQSETAVAEMVDCFLVLMLPGAGDELQGIKKGILELGDLLAVNKADGDQLPLARAAQRDYAAALRYLTPRSESWKPRCVMVSAKTGDGIADLWQLVLQHRAAIESSGELQSRRGAQNLAWMWTEIEGGLKERFRAHEPVRTALSAIERAVLAGELLPLEGAARLLALEARAGE